MASYTIRQFQDSDRGPYLRLFESVFDPRDTAWFRWKYEQNPYIDHVPIFVAETNDELVGARCFFAVELAHGDSTSRVLQPCDTMVHPDHRRQGLMTRMTERAIDTYAGMARLFYNTPNEQALSINRKLGWRIVDTPPTYYRIENLQARAPQWLEQVVEFAGERFLTTNREYKRQWRPDPDLFVKRHDDVPVAALTSLYRQSIAATFHASRDEQFYRWRYANPRWEYRTYLAIQSGSLVASIVTGRRTTAEETITKLIDILPIQSDETVSDAFAVLIDAIIADHRETDIFAVLSPSLPEQLLADFGFVADTTFPLTRLCDGLTLVARPLNDSWTVDGLRLDDPDAWSFTFSERDTC